MFLDRSLVLETVQAAFAQRRLLVVGDLMLDRYLWGEVTRISPEAPVPVVRLHKETENGGGSANVALNLVQLGLQTSLAGWVGQDAAGERLLGLLQQAGIDTSLIQTVANRPTISKTRIIGGHQQMLRLDLEENQPLDTAFLQQCQEQIVAHIHHPERRPQAIILSDYGKGMLQEPLCQTLIHTARQLQIPLLVDPKGMDYRKYRHATVITPNRRELMEAVAAQEQEHIPAGELNRLLRAGERLRQALQIELLAVTLSEQGIALLEQDQEPRRIPAMAREVYDVSGAGDTVISTLAASLASNLPIMDGLHLANLAAGVVVGKLGTTPITRVELLSALANEEHPAQSDKICTLESALQRVTQWRQRGEKIVFTNGCFDLLHAGHVTYLEKARQLGAHLVVGLNTDRSVRALKGPHRPIIHEADRARVLAAMAAVDLVIPFDEETPLTLICTLQPHILAKGADYQEHQVVGGSEVKSWGGSVALVPLVEGRSSTNIMAHIQRQQDDPSQQGA
ncbi:bifunctional D-glycero-beta-D-manno-heptose-7-phosphate kinase/D-glycero-beta-D-manno-heptose 1-phosphate adenylyltransferase HldE [Candidatus Magnetaquicoccus inordinatus]|uniref:bifunctional D-glycero-beta-D-manno-heptose-7-phosphate kinase/D-glycero-beta-D-manno-heptose 1-phosphate adenylyltransferase HldE n=1 Tax=Candidatus Magnetaquicoccus inordinatus TaxID=2496818 RepID=UPI00102AB75C|nr:bifunctional D-glycero-beta-D-manno-heptose-7-phosphate kinase/D-glycero-beta-D-manno-heptose 1-phosphate adenylyltransferase HldE [Candidatus Magnetaquicoccus inordinatus]